MEQRRDCDPEAQKDQAESNMELRRFSFGKADRRSRSHASSRSPESSSSSSMTVARKQFSSPALFRLSQESFLV